METKIQMTDDLKKIKSSFDVSTLKENLTTVLIEAKKICEERNYVTEGSIDEAMSNIKFENSTLTSRKKLAKKMYYFIKKKSLKTMSALFSFIKKTFLGNENKLSVKPSLLEQEIISLRKNYKKLYQETEAARIAFKEKKKLFYTKS